MVAGLLRKEEADVGRSGWGEERVVWIKSTGVEE
jgi:hypothetical protein